MSWMLAMVAVVATLVLIAVGAAIFMILAGGGVFLLRRRSAAAAPVASIPPRSGVPTSVPDSDQPRTVRMLADPRPKPEAPKSLSGFPSLPPGGRDLLVPPVVPGALRSVSPSSPPPPTKKTSGLLGFFDEPPSEPGEAAKTELFQRGKIPANWDDESSEGAEATEIFSALTHETGDEGFVEDEDTTRGKKR
jgi:hypothetical protein